MSDWLDKMRRELRRGVLGLAVVAALREEQYGYSLRKRLASAGIDIEEGTLYPLLRRLEAHGLLRSRWSESDGRKRRYYRISENGESVLGDLRHEWSSIHAALRDLLEGKKRTASGSRTS